MVRQERAVRTREALIRSAAEVFHHEGFTAASLTLISSRAGVSNGALHFHFASKAVLADAVEHAAAGVLQTITGPGPGPGPGSGHGSGSGRGPGSGAGAGGRRDTSTLQRLVDATHELARRLQQDVVLRAGFELSGEAGRPARTDLRLRWHTWVTAMVDAAERRGELRESVAREGVVAAVVAVTVGLEVLGTRDEAWLSRRTVAQFWRLLLPALAPGPALGALEAHGSFPR
ncbi:TetR-family transcriptional regulator [Streptomyces ambofaciens ATCC 23877]|uniref:TetR-family transcriptional regulator n=2 Tax=Streptomyces ambofaciens TaxID=1889 RepID=Q1RQQ3_STRA7|nr:putative TetR-family transcriptional regulator [Streptomyces ambofaciens ATCC 23877]AKZ53262.1 TetR-family transcriptional regulator [Streptomyces ambofaciens ATCC 23877]AKZ60501.1 TetR-family transcriptional regulator [Streptomyces ambofaciens ATCC 23877]CAI78112.1 putative TetR-family transcriptional regulator [Streptomyces ambofaciens ATCC 23877]CAI78386.1 putative TetR-family transcriptional regulator [Streptomyces ambofaciens ATCC 23877]